MRRFLLAPFVFLFFLALLPGHNAQAQTGSVGIGPRFRAERPNPRAVLHLDAEQTNPQGLLLPRLSRTQFVGLTSVENGLIIYDQDENRFYYWVNNDWVALGGNTANPRAAWRSGSGVPDNSVGAEGDFYYDTESGRLYQKDASDGYRNILSFPVLQAGTGIEITNGTINNTGDTDASDDLTVSSMFDSNSDLTNLITNPVIAPRAVTRNKIEDEAVNTDKLANNSVTPDKIAPSVAPNHQLVTNASGVVQWTPITSIVPGSGEISIGNGTGVNNVPMSQDVTLANDGKATVQGLLGRPLDTNVPFINQMLVWDGFQWTYDSPANLVYLGGDLTDIPDDSRVTGLQKRPVADIPPTTGQVLTWSGSQWEPQTPATGGSVTAGNGLTMAGSEVILGGTLGGPTVIRMGVNSLTLEGGPSNSNALDVHGSIRSGWDVTVNNQIGLQAMDASNPIPGSKPYSTSFRTAAQTGDIAYTLPAARPTANGQVLTSTTAGEMSWQSPATGTLPNGTAAGQVLEWNGTSWLPKTVVTAVTELETQTYTTPQPRHLSIDPVDFVLVNEKTSPDVVGVLGDYVRSNSSSGTLAASLQLPDGAVITSVRFLCYDNDTQNISLHLVRSGVSGGETLVSVNTSVRNTSVHQVSLSSSPLNITVDNQTYSYKVVAEMRSNEHRIYGVRVAYTVDKPD